MDVFVRVLEQLAMMLPYACFGFAVGVLVGWRLRERHNGHAKGG